MELNRLATNFPIVATIIQSPVQTGLVAATAAAIVLPFNIHISLVIVQLWLLAYSLRVDKGLANHFVFTPFFVVSMWTMGFSGVGTAIISLSGLEPEILGTLAMMQGISIGAWIIMLVCYRILVPSFAALRLPFENPEFRRYVIKPLCWFGWIMLTYRAITLTGSFLTGGLERGDGYEESWIGFGVWTFFNVLSKYNYTGILLTPLMWRFGNVAGRIVILAFLSYYFLITFISGSRGLWIFAVLMLISGVHAFTPTRRRFRLQWLVAAAAVGIFPLVAFVDAFRNTSSFKSVKVTDIGARIRALGDAKERQEETTSADRIFLTGRAFLGVHDNRVYEMTPSIIPHAGFENFEAIIYTWVPFYFVQDRPILNDSNKVAKVYAPEVGEFTAITISFYADAYRRFGWIGLPICVLFAGIVYASAVGITMNILLKKNALLGLILLIYIAGYSAVSPFSTVLGTWWLWFYDMPKHVIPILIIYKILVYAAGRSSRSLDHYCNVEIEKKIGAELDLNPALFVAKRRQSSRPVQA